MDYGVALAIEINSVSKIGKRIGQQEIDGAIKGRHEYMPTFDRDVENSPLYLRPVGVLCLHSSGTESAS
jgi:hypothetical protein